MEGRRWRCFPELKKVYREKKDSEGMAFVTWAKGGAFRIKGDAADSLKSFKKSLKLFRKLETSME